MLPTRVLYYGRDETLPERIPLRAGPLSLVFEAGDLRTIKLGDQEILRRVYVAVRDHNWGTVPLTLSDMQLKVAEATFQLSFVADHRQGDIHFVWRGLIAGQADGSLTFSMDGEAKTDFWRNRIGFCILHPAQLAGRGCVVEHVDSSTTAGEFPQAISPHQPFFDMRGISHQVRPGVTAMVRFDGDTFEMEDQRNWTDASYKTYCTPLVQPFPVRIEASTKIRQSVMLRLEGDIISPPVIEPEILTVKVANTVVARLPQLGLGVASHGQPLTESEIIRLKHLNLSHLRVDLDLANAYCPDLLRRAWREAKSLGVGLEVALHLTDKAEVEPTHLRQQLTTIRPTIIRWLVLHASEPVAGAQWVSLARAKLVSDAPAQFGIGTLANFTELNRNRPLLDNLDCVSYALTPQIHAFDQTSLVETLPIQAETVANARAFVGNMPICISPVTLKPWTLPSATAPERTTDSDELPSQVDVRQMSLFGAGWTLGSLKYLAESGAHSVTYYETTGWRGVLETAGGSPLPDQFVSIPGGVFPMYHLFADLAEIPESGVVVTVSADPLRVEALALRHKNGLRLLLANLTAESQTVQVAGLEANATIKYLDETNAVAAMQHPEQFRARPGENLRAGPELVLKLKPFALVRIDSRS